LVQSKNKHYAFLMFIVAVIICGAVMAFSTMSAHAAAQKGVVNSKGGLNLRTGAGMKYKVICTIPNKSTVTVKDTKGIWYKISYKGKNGYVGKALIKTVSTTAIERGKSISDAASDSSSDDVSDVINDAVEWAIDTANDDSHGYSQNLSKRWGNPDFDCSTFVTSAYRAAGLDLKYGSSSTVMNCGLMKSVYTAEGFKWIPWSKIGSVSNLKKGDVLLDTSAHTELYIGSGMNAAAHSNRGHAQSGDQTGTEVSVARYYNNVGGIHWDGVLRYVG